MDDYDFAAILQNCLQQRSPAVQEFGIFIYPVHVFFRMQQQRNWFIEINQLSEKTETARPLASVSKEKRLLVFQESTFGFF